MNPVEPNPKVDSMDFSVHLLTSTMAQTQLIQENKFYRLFQNELQSRHVHGIDYD